MTGNNNTDRQGLNRLTDALVDDILNAPDDEILTDFAESHGDPAKSATEMRALFEKALIASNKGRLNAARAAMAADRRSSSPASAIDIAEARQRLRRLLEANASGQSLTLAARKEDELSDADVLGMLEDFGELGVLPPDESGGRRS
jgi:hypothetical protein